MAEAEQYVIRRLLQRIEQERISALLLGHIAVRLVICMSGLKEINRRKDKDILSITGSIAGRLAV